MTDVVNFIEKNKIGKYDTNESLAKHTTYKTGGKASVIVYPKDEKKLILLLKELKSKGIKHKILGKGSNTLFSDKDYVGVIIKLDNFNKIELLRGKVKAGSGVSLAFLSNFTVKKGFSNLEFATGIPGSVGGAVYMNAGAYKSDMGYVVEKIKVLTPNYEVINMTNSELDFHYRTSFLMKHPGYICLEATIKLKKAPNKEELLEIVRDRKERRISSQPLEYPSCGSVFRNPEGDFAGRLIESLGYKGLKKGGAMVSSKHANFVINYNNATSEDIRSLILFLKEEVKEKYNIDLKIEQEFVGWDE